MNWYLVKIVYQIICGQGTHRPQFDEQLRLITAEDDLHAFQKARLIGEKEEDNFPDNNKPVLWKFIDVCEINRLDSLIDGAEMYSRIYEDDNPERYIRSTRARASYLLENSLNNFIN